LISGEVRALREDLFTFLVGGEAGHGVKKTGSVAAGILADMGRAVFQMDDYQSLIRGGHNFSVVSTAVDEISSHYMKANLVVALDDRSYRMHREHLRQDGVMVFNADQVEGGEGVGVPMTTEAEKHPRSDLILGVGAVAVLACALGWDREKIRGIVEASYPGGAEDNVAYAGRIYELAEEHIKGRIELASGDRRRPVLSGNQAIGLGALAAGLDVYLAYPMTPESPLLHFLAEQAEQFSIAVMHPESEVAVANMAIGAASAGARAMVGTSGGGLALMDEALSLAGMTETPLLCILGSRPGPATGVPTYTEQGDLKFALHKGHGEYSRIVASPGSIGEAGRLAAELLDLAWKFQTPAIMLTEKHLAESRTTVDLDLENMAWAEPSMHQNGEYQRYRDTDDGVSPALFPPSDQIIKWNSYEHDQAGITTEKAEIIARMHDKRFRKGQSLVGHLKEIRTVNVFGQSGPLIFTYGSSTMSVLEALRVLEADARVVQPIYLEPLPVWDLEKYLGSAPIVVEQSRAGQFAHLLREKMDMEPAAVIRRYDGRPFEPAELARQIEEVI
jgi:2-oxoglutarate ferredoxin oxidoreductase subunit alpha